MHFTSKKKFLSALFIVFLLLLSVSGHSQSRAELEKKKKQLNQDIEYTNKILKQTQNEKNTSLKELKALTSQIKTREKLIGNINSQLRVLDGEITQKNRNISSLQAQLEQLKKEYAAMVLFAYRNQNAYNKLMFVFAAKDFNQAYKRMKYLQQFGTFRRKQANYIESTQKSLNIKVMELNTNKQEKKGLLTEEQKQKTTLTVEKNKQSKVVGALQSREKYLRQQLAQKQKEAQKLNKAIQTAIRREIEEAQRKAEEEVRRKAEAEAKANALAGNITKPAAAPVKSATGTSALSATPEAAKLSADFLGNRGRLPWPVERGIIVEHFGTHPHPVLPKVMVETQGVDIKTSPGATIRAVFAGEVSLVTSDGPNVAVLIKHGEFFTVYANLKSASVSKGQKVTVKQTIGTIATDAEGNTELDFQIWRGTNKMDPEAWLAN
ncbi:murein hydrolase activator EnvC family protein [Solitalea koreensis]|uniref:Septal ring factor EnvC, activator of murein hydrolases AmiA and AmiB n=1 Tax=Solitalea koreensis TaxID=543615 RepID=A0A521CRK4_9SPHI|nr:peptidoglycan DD-metalloendopeptidase family protein [Solitalea koreensis]SMO62038.1 Septal ring factor EnvC, activator of murein hydrolases AmiA and AmiB [Solitalea koreensis]